MKDTIKEQFEAAGFLVEIQTDLKHWKLRGHNLCIHYWPNTASTFVYGKSFKAFPGDLVAAVKAGRIRLPDTAREAICKSCGAPIWWVHGMKGKIPTGKKLPVNPDGESHFSSCPYADQHRKAKPHNSAQYQAAADFYRGAR